MPWNTKKLASATIAFIFILTSTAHPQTQDNAFFKLFIGEKFQLQLAEFMQGFDVGDPVVNDILTLLNTVTPEASAGAEGKPMPPLSNSEKRAQLEQARKNLSRSRESLAQLRDRVARGQYKSIFPTEFWTRCEAVISVQADAANKAIDSTTTASTKLEGAAPEELKASQDAQACYAEYDATKAKIEQNIAALDKTIVDADQALKTNEEQFKNSKISKEDHDRIKKEKEKEKEDAQKQKKQEEGAKEAVNSWALVAGLALVAAGLVLVFCYDIADGWALVTTGLSMVAGSGGGGSGDGNKGSGPGKDGQTAAVGPSASSADSTKVGEAAKSPAPANDNDLKQKYKEPEFVFAQPSAPGGNIYLLLARTTKSLVLVRGDTKEEVIRIALDGVVEQSGYWKLPEKLTDLTAANKWELTTKSGYVVLRFEGDFAGKKSPISIIESIEPGQYTAGSY
ncbi:hypothetical protein N1937_00965 [Rhizobium sp. WSM4643]|uniref:hypothetical protein n=1 Tax=Rhizobium sp. WSM4643 TaxID=3138253 RepID=UPI0021A62C6D|nr:hypothetical protein [Rhizobium leguminosarum]UWM75852.1 hypothetical protein N1937_00965 [Rhizobium leguminosarum bv. viciae]